MIVPCFNDGATLTETVESIRREPLPLELVIVDDGSTDGSTLSLLSSLERETLHVIHQANAGPSAAAMAGLRATSAPYVMRVDADDLLEPGALGDLADALDSNPHAALAWGDVQTFGLTTFRIAGVPALDPWLLTYTNCITGAGTLFRRSALVECGGWRLRDGYEDWDLFMSFAELNLPGAHVPRIAFRYRRDSEGRHAESLPRAAEHYKELRRRHESLFAKRSVNRRCSSTPRAVKFLVPLIEMLPCLSRLTKIHLCELVARLWWGGGFRATAPMMLQAAVIRSRGRMRRRGKNPTIAS